MFRYKRRLPPLRDVPLINNGSATNPCGRQFNLTNLHHLDSSRFIVSLSHVDDYWSESDGNVVRHRTSRSQRGDLRHRKTNKSNDVKLTTSSTKFAEPVVVDLDLDCFRLIFVAVDVAIVAFHLCRGYFDLHRLQRFRCRCGGQFALRNGDLTTTAEPLEDGTGLLPSDGLVPAVCNDAMSAQNTLTTTSNYVALNEPESDMTLSRQERSSDVLQRRLCAAVRTTTLLVCRVVRSRSLLPLLASVFILSTSHCVVRSYSRLSAAHLSLSSDTLTSDLATDVRLQTATAKANLIDDTRHLDSAVLQLASSSMTQDLYNILRIVNYFRQG